LHFKIEDLEGCNLDLWIVPNPRGGQFVVQSKMLNSSLK